METKEEASRILNSVENHQAFWVNNGPVLHSLDDLATNVKKISEEQFTHHVNSDRNDFVTWISEVLGDLVLAEKIGSLKTRTSVAKFANQRVKHLTKHVK